MGCSPWGRKELDMTEQLPFHFSLSCIGEGNGNPLQCSCLENRRDGGAWWAAIYGVAQSQTQLKRLSSSSSSSRILQVHSSLANLKQGKLGSGKAGEGSFRQSVISVPQGFLKGDFHQWG